LDRYFDDHFVPPRPPRDDAQLARRDARIGHRIEMQATNLVYPERPHPHGTIHEERIWQD
jgi:hypothetical protein